MKEIKKKTEENFPYNMDLLNEELTKINNIININIVANCLDD